MPATRCPDKSAGHVSGLPDPQSCAEDHGNHLGRLRADDGTRTRISSLEGWDPTFRSHPHAGGARSNLYLPFEDTAQWSPLESNQPPPVFQTDALPSELGDQAKAKWLAFQARLLLLFLSVPGGSFLFPLLLQVLLPLAGYFLVRLAIAETVAHDFHSAQIVATLLANPPGVEPSRLRRAQLGRALSWSQTTSEGDLQESYASRQSRWTDSNRRPHAPEACALPSCATSR